jgi:lambda family phage minor tail protein L
VTAPLSHHVDALELEGQAEVDLWEIVLNDGLTVFRFRNGPSVTWQSDLYENLPIAIGGEEHNSDDKQARPALRIYNPKSIFGPYAMQKAFDLALVTRRRVLGVNLAANANIFEPSIWVVRRVVNVTSQMLHLELSSPLDGPSLMVPHRTYVPPDFPSVSF